MTMTLDEALAELPVVAIVRGIRPDEILDHAEVIYQAGIRAIEVPLNSPNPMESIRRLAEAYGDRITLGAGTVLKPEEVDEVARNGGRIIVAPNTTPSVIRRAVELGLDPAPGFATATEAFTALDAGARHLKMYPASTYGAGHLKQLMDVMPAQAVLWAVGGVGADQMAEWWAAGARGFGVGSGSYKAGQSVAESKAKAERLVAGARALPR
jgi:2-dehydro-3-deoxyphosphogalactonate aldolase